MADTDVTQGELELSVPWDEVQKESQKVIKAFRKQVRIPGFRPGKAPDKVIETRYGGEIRSEVIETLVGRYFWKKAQDEDYHVIGTPSVSDVEYKDGEALTFKASFEMVPDFELGNYKNLSIPYADPETTDEEIDQELERIRDQQASFKNLDPRPIEDGDIAVVSLKSEEIDDAPAIDQSETTILVGGDETMAGFSDAFRGKSPGDEVDFEVEYPEDFGNEQLAGKTIQFHSKISGIRVKELPDLDDDFAADVGDFQTLDELKDRIREELLEQKRQQARSDADEKIIDALVAQHEFAIPEKLIEQQISTRLERTARMFAGQGVDPSTIDWSQMRDGQREGAIRDVKAGLILERITEAEAIEADSDEIDGEIEAFAKRNQMTLGAARKKLAEDGTLDRIESHYVNQRTMTYLFDQSVKTDPPEDDESGEKKDYYEEALRPEKSGEKKVEKPEEKQDD